MPLPTIIEAIGATPLIRLDKTSRTLGLEVLAKLEGQNPGGSVKDRVAWAMVKDAEERGLIRPGDTLVEPTSGNTGIALAMIAAARGYRLILTMPEAMSRERVALLRAFGAEVILTPGTLMHGAVEQAELLVASEKRALTLGQFSNPANPRIHERTTAEELWRDTEGNIDFFVAGVGTGGTITGVARALKPRRPELRIVAVEPREAPALSGGKIGQHGIQGIGAGFIPAVLDQSLIDEVVPVSYDEALDAAKRLAREDGVLAGISSGAAIAAVARLAARRGNANKRVVVVLPDNGERYMSTPLFSYDKPRT